MGNVYLGNERIGVTSENKYGSIMKIVQYNNARDILVKFNNYDKTISSNWHNFCIGEIRSPYDISICGLGYLGEGEYKSYAGNGKQTAMYLTWLNMIRRCYDLKELEKHPSYKGCAVTKEWLNYQNFGVWYDENFYQIDGETMALDKDILNKGNKIYSPETCTFVPQRINTLFVKNDSKRGEFPLGVHYKKSNNKYTARCSVLDNQKKRKQLGDFDTPEKAFHAYKIFKENYIKQVANEYKDKIPTRLYEAMMKYIVEITD